MSSQYMDKQEFCDTINIAFVNNCFNSNTFSVFTERFKLVSESHAHNTRSQLSNFASALGSAEGFAKGNLYFL